MHRSIFNIAVNTRPSHGCWMPFLGPAAPWNTTYSKPQIIKHHLSACLAPGFVQADAQRWDFYTFDPLVPPPIWFFFFFLVWNIQVWRGIFPVFYSYFYCWHLLAVGVSCLLEQKPDEMSCVDLCALLMGKALGKLLWRSAGATAWICQLASSKKIYQKLDHSSQ